METKNIAEVIAILVGNIKSLDTWAVLGIAAGFGALGGLAHKLTSPPEDRTSWPGYLVVGAVASLAILFVFTPSEDAVRFIAISLAAGYGGKAVLDALEARVKTALAEAETAKTKDDGKKAVEAGKEAVSQAEKLSQINRELEKDLMKVKGQQREEVYEGLLSLPADLQTFAAESPDAATNELKKLSLTLKLLEESFEK
jgi:hypothetical protein